VPVHSLGELIAYNEARPERMLRYGQAQLRRAEATSGALTEAAYVRALIDGRRRSRAEGIDRSMEEHRMDALLFPGSLGAAVAAAAGYPSVTVPAGLTDVGAAVGLTFTATAFTEGRLLALAYAFEQACAGRQPPRFENASA
jgi:amidase